MITLYPDQQELYDKVRAKIGEGYKSTLMQLSTGGGKTAIAGKMIRGAYDKGTTSHFIVPRKELINQTSKTIREKFDIPHYSFIAAGREERDTLIKICSKDTLIKRLDKTVFPKLVFIDEVHFGGKGLNEIIQAYREAGSIVIGLTATPQLGSGKGMDHQFDTMVCGKSTKWLIENKRLAEYEAFAPNVPDFSMIKKVAGEYHKGQINSKMESDKALIGNCVSHYKQHAMGKLGITFAQSIEHSEMLAESYRSSGVPAMHMDGNTPDDERRKIIRALAKREILQICNVDLCTFGFDLSAASGMDVTIECMSDMQKTASLTKQLQKWGRFLRYDGTQHVLFDHAGNIGADGDKHGLPCSDREWSLQGRKKGSREDGERAIPSRRCPKCFFCHPPSPVCPNDLCTHYLQTGFRYEYPVQSRSVEEIEGELKKIEKDKIKAEKKEKRMEVGQCKTFEDLLKISKERNYKWGWIVKMAKVKGIKIPK